MSYRRYDDRDDFGGGGRWDRERFERARAKSRPRDSFRFEEEDRYGPRGFSRNFEFDDRFERRGGPRDRLMERERTYEDDRYRNDRRLDFMEEDRYRGGKEIAPYMNRFDQEPPPRPGMIRRRSSWNDFERREYPEPRYYEDRDRDRQNNDMRLNIRLGSPHERDERPRSAIGDPKDRYDDRKSHFDDRKSHFDDRKSHFDDRKSHYGDRKSHYDDQHIDIDERVGDRRINIDIDEGRRNDDRYRRDEPRYYREQPEYYRGPRDYEDYNGARIIRERERIIDRRAESPRREEVISPPQEDHHHHDVENHEYKFEETHIKEEAREERPAGTKKGRTRMPKRLVHYKAIADLGYPYDEEDDFYVIRYALAKEQIDECIKVSENYREYDKTVYSYEREKEETKAIEAPPTVHEFDEAPPQQPQEEFEETVVRKVIENPTEEEYERFRANGEYEVTNHGSDDEHKTVVSDHRSEAKSRHRSKSRRRSKSHKRRSKSRRRNRRNTESEYRSERIEYDSDGSSPHHHRHHEHGEIVLPERRRKDHNIKSEIKALEAERRALRHEREYEDRRPRLEIHRDRNRSSSISSDDREGSVRIEKDRRGRLNLVRHDRPS
ncbi:MAG: hypothetical protein Q9162_000083 [Coniocarpon cinnabarinum]